jgi:predicted dehydrogenase
VEDLPRDADPRRRRAALVAGDARPVEVYAVADAVVAPDFSEAGLLDTPVVLVRFDSGSIATADASFSAAYGYDVWGRGVRLRRHGDCRIDW